MKLKHSILLFAALLSGANAFAGSVLVYRNSGWRISDWKYQLGQPESLGDRWQQPGFDDATWPTGKGAFGHGTAIRVGTLLKEMPGAYTTICLRTEFFVSDKTKLNDLILDVNTSGGFIAWINGVGVAGRNPPEKPSAAAVATASRKTTAVDYESIPLRNPAGFLRNGENVLAIQVSDAAVTWQDVATEDRRTHISGGDIKLIVDMKFVKEIPARHVRFFGRERDDATKGFYIVEFAVFRDAPAAQKN